MATNSFAASLTLFLKRRKYSLYSFLASLLLVSSVAQLKAQCTLGASSGTTITPCIGNYSTTTLNSGQYSLLNVIKGYTYQINTDCAPFNAEIALFDNSNNPIGFNNTGPGCAYTQGNLSYTATYTGQIKISLTEKLCLASGKTATLSVTVPSPTNTFDSQSVEAISGWLGHMYQEPTMGVAPGPPNSVKFLTFEGDFNEPGTGGPANLNFNEIFGTGGTSCFPLLSNNIVSVNSFTDQVSVHFLNKNTLDGIYQITIGGDDGIRLSFDEPKDLVSPSGAGTTGMTYLPGLGTALWFSHSYTTATTLVSLNGSNDGAGAGFNHFKLDYYQDYGANQASFNITGADNTLSTPNSTVCSGSSASITGTDFYATYPAATFQWQVSTSPTTNFVNVSSSSNGNLQYYLPNIFNTSGAPQTYYFRRQASTGGVTHSSNVVTWTVNNETTTQFTVSGGGPYCSGTSGDVINLSGSQTGLTYTLQRNVPGGLNGEYFGGTTVPGTVPTFTRVDPTVNFILGAWPGGGIGPTNFAVRWTGQLLAPTTGSYTISTNSDDGVRVWLNGNLIIDDFTAHSGFDNSNPISLVAGNVYAIKIEYYQYLNGAHINLFWTPPSSAQVIIPASQLYNSVDVTSLAGTGSPLTFSNILPAGIYTIVASSSSVCSRAMNGSATVTVIPTPAPSTISANQTICTGSAPALLTSTAASGGSGPYTYQWNSSTTSATLGFSPASGASTAVSYQPPALTQTTYYQLVITSVGCSSISNSVAITVGAIPTASNAGPAQSLCNVTSTTLAANTPVIGTGTWSEVSGPAGATFSSTTTANTTVTALTTGTYVFQWTIASSSCPPSASTVQVVVGGTPTASDAGKAQSLCSVTSTTLAGNTPVVGTGTWSEVAGPAGATFTNANQSNTTVTALTTGTYSFQWSIASGSCVPSASTVQVVVGGMPTASNAGPAQSLCNVTSTTLAANSPVVGTGTWSELSGTTYTPFTNANQNNTTVTGLTTGTYVFQWSIASGSCSPSTSTVQVVVGGTPTAASTSPAQSLCNVTSTTLAGNSPATGTGTWSQVSGPAGATFSSTATANTTVTALTTGTYVFQWSIASGSCQPSTSTVQVDVGGTPTASNAGRAQSLCNVTTTTLAGNIPATGTGTWSQVSGPAGATFANANLNTTTVTALTTGTYVFQWSIASGSCPPSTSTVQVVVGGTPPAADAGRAQSLCNVTTTTLAGNSPATGTGTWSELSGPAGATFTNANLNSTTVTALTTGTYVFQWSIASGSCSPSTSSVQVVVGGTPTAASTGPAQSLCNATSTTLAGNSPVVGTGTWSQVSGPAGATFTNANLNTTTVTGLTTGTYVFQWSIASGSCPLSTSTVQVVVGGTPTASTAGPAQSLCNATSTALAGNSPATGTGTWSELSGPAGATFTNANQNTTTVTALTTGTYVFQWSIASGSCPPSTSSVQVVVGGTPTASTAGPAQSLCNATSTALAGNSPVVGTGTWSQVSGPAGATFTNANLNTTTVTALTTGTYVFQWSITSGSCPPATSTVQVVVGGTPTASNAGPAQSLCNSLTNATLAANVPSVGTGLWTQIKGPHTATFVDATLNNTAVTGLMPGIYSFQWTITSGSCPSSSSTVRITVDDLVLTQTHSNVACSGTSTGTITATGTKGVGAYQYALNGGPLQSTGSFINLAAGTYTISLTDAGGCTQTSTVKITQPIAPISSNITSQTDNKCKGDASGSATVKVMGGTGAYTYAWNTTPVQATATASNLMAGLYILKITDSSGCQAYQSVMIGEPASKVSATILGTNATCAGEANGKAVVTASGGTGPYTYSWTTSPQTTASINGLIAGRYTVTVTDASGCLGMQTVTIGTNAPPVAVSDNASVIKDKPINFKLKLNAGTAAIDPTSVDLDLSTPGVQSSFTVPGKGSFTSDKKGGIAFTPVVGYSGSVVITYQVADINGCLSNAATIFIMVKAQPPVAMNDTTSTFPASRIQIPVLANDTDPQGSALMPVILTQPAFGSVTVLPSGMIQYTSIPEYLGTVTFTYRAMNSLSPALSSNTATVTIKIVVNPNATTLTIPTAFTPNGDGANDVFAIKNLYLYPNNEIQIFNRWGNQVYHATSYMQSGRTWDGSNLSAGTYYYVLRVSINGISKTLSGYTTIIR